MQLRRILGEWYPEFILYFFDTPEDWMEAVQKFNVRDLDILNIFREAAHSAEVGHF